MRDANCNLNFGLHSEAVQAVGVVALQPGALISDRRV